MRNWNFLTIISLTLVIFSCNRIGSVQEAILEKSKVCGTTQAPCMFDFKTVTPFKWDKMYIFDEYTSAEKISFILKMDYSKNVNEDKTRLIFMLNDKIIHQEDFDWGKKGKRVLNNINLPIDTLSKLTDKGCYTSFLPFVRNSDCFYRLDNIESANRTVVNLLFAGDLNRCSESQITFEAY